MGVNGGWGQMGLQDAPCRRWDAASGTEGSHGVVWGQLWGQRGRMGSRGVNGVRGIRGSVGVGGSKTPPPCRRRDTASGTEGSRGVSCGVSGVVWGHSGVTFGVSGVT